MKSILHVFSIFLAAILIFAPEQTFGQTSYTDASVTTSWNSSRWNNSSDGPTYTSNYAPSNAVHFTSGSYSFAGMGATVNIGNITVASGVTVSFTANANTLATNGNIRTINVGSNSVFDLANQAVSTTAGTGFNKTGLGTLVIGTGGGYNGGFTLSGGTMVADGVNSMGNHASNTLTLAGGILATGSVAKTFTGKFGGGIFISGNFQIGEINANNSKVGNGNLTFTDNVSLGNAHRTITLGNSALYTFSGIISNTGSNGITFTANTNGTGRFDITNTANTFSGPISINGDGSTGIAEVRFTSDGSFGNLTNTININGGRLSVADNGVFALTAGRGIQVGNTQGTSIFTTGLVELTYNGVIADLVGATPGILVKQGTGTLVLGGSNTYSGATTINAGTLRIAAANALPIASVLNLGQAGNTNIGTFNLNGFNQEVAGINSITGTNVSASLNNLITSTTPAILTVNGSGSFGDGTNANSGIITDQVSLVKSGVGTLTLGDANTYTGSTTVNGGVLQLNRSSGTTINPLSPVTINNGGILKISSNQTISSITLNAGGILMVDAGATLTIDGDLTVPSGATLALNGIITSTGSNRTLTINAGATLTLGNSAGLSTATGTWTTKNLPSGASYVFTTATTTPFGNDFTTVNAVNLTINASISLDKYVNLSGLLLVQNNATLTTAGNLRLKSTSASATAMVGTVAGTITGNVTHERYLSAPANASSGRSWRLLTSPLKGNVNNSVFYNWQNNGTNDNTGIEIWGPGGTGIIGNGLATGPSSSLRTYNSTTNAYVSVTDTKNETLFGASGNKPFLVFVSGHYNSGNISSGSGATNSDATGELITGTQTYNFIPPSSSNIYYLVGNPYACPLDFDKVWNNNPVTSNINRTFWAIDPNLGNIGAYATVTYDDNSSSYITSVGSQNQYIQNGQAFFVEGNSVGNPSTLIIQEDDKETNAAQTPIFRTNGGSTETFRVQLFKQINLIPILLDGTIAVCHQNNSNALNDKDALKFTNFNESISILHGSKKLSIEKRTLYDIGDTLKIALSGLQQASYQLVFQPANINASYLTATLLDNFLSTATPVSLTTNTTYAFSVTSNSASSSDGRFMIVFGGTNPLSAAKFTSVEAKKIESAIAVKWTVSEESEIRQYDIERSINGTAFHKIGSQLSDKQNSYSWNDTQPNNGDNYYRIKAVARSTVATYSQIVKASMAHIKPYLTLYPNPTEGPLLTVDIEGLKTGNYEIVIINALGQEAARQTLQHNHTQSSVSINIEKFSPGLYFLQLMEESGSRIAEEKILKQ